MPGEIGKIGDTADKIDMLLYNLLDDSWGGTLEMTEQVEQKIEETRNAILDLFS